MHLVLKRLRSKKFPESCLPYLQGTLRSQQDEYRNQPGLDKSKDKERDQIEGRGTAPCVSAICFLFSCVICMMHFMSNTHNST